MAKEGDYKIENIYGGGYSSFSPSYGDIFTGYHVSSSELGAPTKPDTANQIQQVGMLLNQGIIPIEVGVMQPEVFDQIPKTHFKEINRMAKLAGAKVSVHAPIIEPSGIGEQGWTEANREVAEKQLMDVVEKTAVMDDKGSMPITIHSSGLPGKEYKMVDEGNGRKKKVEKIIIVDRDTGKPVQAIEEETMFYPDQWIPKEGKTREDEIRVARRQAKKEDVYEKVSLDKGKTISPERRIETINRTQWDTSVSQLIFNKERADEILQQNQIQIQQLLEGLNNETIDPRHLTPTQKQALNHRENAKTLVRIF